jgi:twitching motility protein PilT
MNQKDALDQLLTAMTATAPGLSDLLFIPGHLPQMNCSGHLRAFRGDLPEPVIGPQFTTELAAVIMGDSERLANILRKTGSCDCAYDLAGVARFRVNIYRQMGHLAVAMRKLPIAVPTLDELKLPSAFREIARERNGLIFVTGATGMGKSTTLAALLNELNRTEDIHVITLEDPVEYLYPPNQASFSQRELGKDFFNYAEGLRAALRQAPGAIMVGEIRDRETMEVALMAAETGHVVFATLHTIDASQSVQRILGLFEKSEESLVRQRLSSTLRWVVSQRLIPKIGGGRQLVTEIMGSNLRSREALLLGEADGRMLHEIIETAGKPAGWHSFEQSLLKAYLEGSITEETAVLHSTHKNQVRQAIDASRHLREVRPSMIS